MTQRKKNTRDNGQMTMDNEQLTMDNSQFTTHNLPLIRGYKNTEIGLIPEDWNIQKIGSLADIATGSTPPTNDRTNYGNEFLFVSPADLGKGTWIENSEKKLSIKGFVTTQQELTLVEPKD